MNILLATYWAIPHLGGVWNYMSQLREKLEALGHNVDLLGNSPDNEYVYITNTNRFIPSEIINPIVENELKDSLTNEIFSIPLLGYTEKQRKKFEISVEKLGLNNYDIIHTQDIISTGCIKKIIPAHVPLIATIHGCVAREIRLQMTDMHVDSNSPLTCSYYDDLERVGANVAPLTIVANNWLKKIYTDEFFVPEEQIKIVHYGFDIDNFYKKMSITNSVLKPENKKVIIFTGRVTQLKGVHHLIDALALIKQKRSDFVVWIVGTGDLDDEIKKQAQNLGLDKDVIFFGSRSDVAYLLSLSDIFVLPSLLDNQPLSLIEALLSGNACVVSDVGGLPEMVTHNVTGFITKKGDKHSIAEMIELLLENDDIRKKIAAQGKAWAIKHWNMDKQVALLLEQYHYVIAAHKPHSLL